MAEEEVVAPMAAATSSTAGDLKRKHQEMEAEEALLPNGKEAGAVEGADVEGEEEEAVTDELEAKRPRLEEEEEEAPEPLVVVNGVKDDKVIEPVEEEVQPSEENNIESETAKQAADEALESVDGERPSTDDQQVAEIQPPVAENAQLEISYEQPSEVKVQEPYVEVPQQVSDLVGEEPPKSETQKASRKIEVPNSKVGVLIGKAGDTIKFLQINSGAKIQIMRDADVKPQSTTRPVELIGSLEEINKAEKLIKDVIAEADAGGSPSLVARGFSTIHAAGALEEVLIQVPHEKVGVIIGKGGETIKNLQTRAGARIQLLPVPEGDQSKERTVRVTGDKKQIERAREMIKDVMNQPARQSSSGGYSQQQSFRPRGGPSSQQQWGSRGSNAAQPTGYDYQQQRGPYPSSQHAHHGSHGYSNYPPHGGPRSSYGPAWEQRPGPMQGGPPHQGGGYDYYGGQGQMAAAPSQVPHSNVAHGPGPNPSAMGPPPSQGNYYGQPHGGQPSSYPAAQGYGQQYGENRYSASQPQGYAPPPHDQYGKAPPPSSYGGMPPHHGPPAAQTYGQPRGDVPYQGGGPIPSQQAYGQNPPPPQQQTYPYAAATGQAQHPQYGSQSATDAYNQQQMYPQQSGGQPVAAAGYGQHGPGGYAQQGTVAGGYGGSYPTMQQGYGGDQSIQNNAGGYTADPAAAAAAYGGGPAYGSQPTGQAGYAQQVPAQPGYDQSAPPAAGGYGGVAAAPAGYQKTTVSPQPGYPPQYDASAQMYGAPSR